MNNIFDLDRLKSTLKSVKEWTNQKISDSIKNLASKDDVILKTNTSTYEPTDSYNPATKKYVDDKVSAIAISGGSVQSDWSQNDSTALDYIKNRICYEEPGFEAYETNVLAEDTNGEVQEMIYDGTYSYYYECASSDTSYSLESGKEYIIKIGNHFGSFKYTSGDSLIFGTLDSEKITILIAIGYRVYMAGFGTNINCSGQSISIGQMNGTNIVTIDKKYIPSLQEQLGITESDANKVLSVDSTGNIVVTEGGGSSDSLSLSNTIEYTPTSDYNHATKKYVDDNVGNIKTLIDNL